MIFSELCLRHSIRHDGTCPGCTAERADRPEVGSLWRRLGSIGLYAGMVLRVLDVEASGNVCACDPQSGKLIGTWSPAGFARCFTFVHAALKPGEEFVFGTGGEVIGVAHNTFDSMQTTTSGTRREEDTMGEATTDGEWVLEEAGGAHSYYPRPGWIAKKSYTRTDVPNLAMRFPSEAAAIAYRDVRHPETRKTFLPVRVAPTVTSAPVNVAVKQVAASGHVATRYTSPTGEELIRVEASGSVYVRGQLATTPIEVADGMRAWCVEMTERHQERERELDASVQNLNRKMNAGDRDWRAEVKRLQSDVDRRDAELNFYRAELRRHDPRLVDAHERNKGK